jgi:biopolymer transport protein ExbB
MLLELVAQPLESFHAMRELGGPVVDWIFLSCVVMWAIVTERLWYFKVVLPREASQLLNAWQARPDRTSWASHQVRKAMISRLNSGMGSNLQLLGVLVPMAPLLGLVGTVSGMLGVFDSMAALGSADARSMASGVSEAMVCTLTGLAVSITGLYPVYHFKRMVREETERWGDRFEY